MAYNEQSFKHPSYGMAVFSRIQSTGSKLFGSDIEHDTIIGLTISNASEHVAHYGKTRYFPYETQVEVYFSASQFAELLTNMNTSGVPCTFNRKIDETGKMITCRLPTNRQTKAERVRDVIKQRAKDLIQGIAELSKKADKIMESKTISKGEFKAFAEEIKSMKDQLSHGMPWYLECLQEEIDKTVQDAKSSVEDFVNQKVHQTGIEALHNMKLLK